MIVRSSVCVGKTLMRCRGHHDKTNGPPPYVHTYACCVWALPQFALSTQIKKQFAERHTNLKIDATLLLEDPNFRTVLHSDVRTVTPF